MKKIIRKLSSGMVRVMLRLTAPFWSRVFRYIARTGYGTEVCIENGFLPMPIHYYSPIPDLIDLEKRQVWKQKSDLSGINFLPESQVKLIQELGDRFGDECNWPTAPTGRDFDFYTENGSFSFGCAAGLHTILRKYKPGKVIEIGSGNSSLVISAALARNHEDGHESEYTIIDPYPSKVACNSLPGLTKLIKDRVELTDIHRFDQLEQNDILFIDSGHTVRTGSDVNFLFLEVLPRLKTGVLVHFHDISLPYEYSQVYFTNPAFRVFWTEAYLLQAFLIFNSQFKILLGLNYLMSEYIVEFSEAFRHYDPQKHLNNSGSFWIQRISG